MDPLVFGLSTMGKSQVMAAEKAFFAYWTRLRRWTRRNLDGLGPARSGIVVITFGSALGQLILVGGMLILARLFDPAAFGVYSWVSTLIMLLSLVAALRLELAIPLAEDDIHARRLVSLALGVAFGASALVTMSTPLVGPWIDSLSELTLMPSLYFVGPSVFATAAVTIYSQVLLRRKSYSAVGHRSSTVSGMTVVLQALGGVISGSPGFLLLGQFLARLLVSLRMAWSLSLNPPMRLV